MPNSFTTILIYIGRYRDFFDDLKKKLISFYWRHQSVLVSLLARWHACAYQSRACYAHSIWREGLSHRWAPKWNFMRKRELCKKKGWWAPSWNPTQVESCAPPSSRAACSHLCHELAWDIDCYVVTIGFTSVIIRVSPDGTVIILAVKEDEADHEHVDGEVGEDVALVAVHQVQQLAPGLVRARQVLQHRLACHPFNIQVPLLWKHL